MVEKTGRNVNFNDTATVTTVPVNSVTATVAAAANPKRRFLRIDLDPEMVDRDVFVRLYPAADDDLPRGMVLTRRSFANDSLFNPFWESMPDNPYTGEVSVLSLTGLIDVHVTEY